jgi:hypothetical protein
MVHCSFVGTCAAHNLQDKRCSHGPISGSTETQPGLSSIGYCKLRRQAACRGRGQARENPARDTAGPGDAWTWARRERAGSCARPAPVPRSLIAPCACAVPCRARCLPAHRVLAVSLAMDGGARAGACTCPYWLRPQAGVSLDHASLTYHIALFMIASGPSKPLDCAALMWSTLYNPLEKNKTE